MTIRRLCLSVTTTVSIAFLAACQPPAEPPAETPAPAAESAAASGVVEVRLEDFAFHAPPRLASGWTTFRMTNEGEQPHFMILWRLPEGVDFAQYAEFGRMFQDHYDRYFRGEATQKQMIDSLTADMPEWFGALGASGGVALTSPGKTAETTVLLEPGDYVMECYVVTPEGEFHGSLGMLRPLIVTEEKTSLAPPEPDVRITLYNGLMEVEGEPGPGEQVIAVHAAQHADGIIMHDVNLARLNPLVSLGKVVTWMNWIDALRPPAPAEFLGGADHLAGGSTAYFRTDLGPGRYVFVSEAYGGQGMVHEFRVQ